MIDPHLSAKNTKDSALLKIIFMQLLSLSNWHLNDFQKDIICSFTNNKIIS